MDTHSSPLTRSAVNAVAYKILGAAIEVHKAIGPGLLESVYQKCLFRELSLRKMHFVANLSAPIQYKGMQTESELRCDFFVENCVVVEIKAIEGILPVHEAQCYTYMKLLRAPKGMLINFNCLNIFRSGQRALVNEYFRDLAA